MTNFEKVNLKQSFPQLEENILNFWKQNEIFEESISSRPESNPYRFYDGPPFITGTPHYGSLLSSICKDVVPRYHTMKGKRCERVWGWDCHGIPIEDKVQKELGLSSSKEIEANGIDKFIEGCYKYTQETSAEWEWYVDHIGRWVDFKNSYKTMDQSYMESVLNVFQKLYNKGLIYKGKRTSLYSWKLSTPISNFEIAMDDSYEEVSDPAITVMFPLEQDGKKHVKTGDNILAWTTTPWTMPTHMAIAVNKEIAYSRVLSEGQYFILATARVETVFKGREYEIIESFMGDELVGLKYTPPFDYYKGKISEEKNFITYHADFVTDSDGVGIAHEAPEFGDVDFEMAKVEGIHITSALDNEGRYTSEIADLEGTHYQEANDIVSERLKERGLLFKKESINHRVAMCPRTGTPLIYKVQESWFINIASIKDKLIEENEGINWSPKHLKHGQFLKSMEGAPDWCISRTRYWGTPMPIWMGYDTDGNEKDMKVFGSIEEIETASGMTVKDLHRPYIDEVTWAENGLTYKRIPEVLDCWVESGSMPYAQDHYPFENKEKMEAAFPADFIVEYIGQVRAWFYVMHVMGVALFDTRAFTNVITTGIVNGNDGRKMSKSYKNYPDPRKTIETYGADAIRFYMMNSPLMSGGNLSFKEEQVHEVVKKVILPLWNTYSFFTTYANIDNFKPENDGHIYFVRHGQTHNNVANIMNGGDVESDLTEKGIVQAIEAGKNFALTGVKLDKIIITERLRSKDTAQYIKNQLGYDIEIEVNNDFNEQLSGNFKGMTHDDIVKKYNLNPEDTFNIRKTYKDKSENGVEDVTEYNSRIEKAFLDLKEKSKGKNILIVAHSGTFRPINKVLNNLSIEDAFYNLPSAPNSLIIKLPNYTKNNNLDKWIISELNQLTKEVTLGFEEYKLSDATKPIVKFMDNLTNWYIRRSRKRFWKSENDGDKMEAYNTLYDVLVELSKIIAPFMPFISEHIYKELTGKKSVHLEIFPDSVPGWIFEGLNTDTNRVQNIITLGLAWRANNKIRVRQPLTSITITDEISDYYKEIIKEELNVKEVFIVDGNTLAKQICKPNGRVIGPKFGKDVKFIISEAKNGKFTLLKDGNVQVGDFILEEGDFELVFEASETTYSIEAGFGIVIAMDDHITPELMLEGYYRDIVRYVQEGRKEAEYNVDDRIEINISSTDSKISEILETFGNQIQKESLSTINTSLSHGDIQKEIEVDDMKITLILKK